MESADEDEMDDDLMCEMEDVEASRARQASTNDDVAPEGREVLTRVTNVQRQMHLAGTKRRRIFFCLFVSLNQQSQFSHAF